LSTLGFYIDLGNVKPLTNIKLSLDITNKFQIDKTARLIGIAPFAQYDSKIYPQDLMQIVINELSLNSRNQILLFGGGSAEIEKLNALKNNLDNVIVIAGEISFKQELEIIFNLDLMLSMDSGNAHIAAMYNVPTVTLWGATHPIAGFNPFRQPLINALVSDRAQYPLIPTSIYGNQIVAGYQDAMRTIAPETVVARINKILNKSI
jgi:ADP-heptose:LPS heptosyltransferase